MAWQKSQHSNPEEFKINFTSMAQATEWLIIFALKICINASIMGRQENISATRKLKNMIPTSWIDAQYATETQEIERELSMKQNQCLLKTGKYDDSKLNDALDTWADNTFKTIWNLLSRIGKLPQRSEISEDD